MTPIPHPLPHSPEWSASRRGASGRGPVRVAFQGAAGAFSEEAIHAFFGEGRALSLPQRDFRDVGDAVRSGAAEIGMLPAENTIAGGVTGAFDVLASGDLVIVGEIVRPIRHCLLAVEGAALEGVRRVISHPVALAQCTRFLGTLAGTESVAVFDTAGAAREVAERGDPEVAAVAARGAAARYGLRIIEEDIQDRDDNQTRFFIVVRAGRETVAEEEWLKREAPEAASSEAAPRRTKVVLLLETAHRSGALVAALQPFGTSGVNLVHILSRPAEVPWHYRFFVEVEVDGEGGSAEEAIGEARLRARSLRVLGSFPCGVDRGGPF